MLEINMFVTKETFSNINEWVLTCKDSFENDITISENNFEFLAIDKAGYSVGYFDKQTNKGYIQNEY
jgi:hypothetical protein